MNKNKRIDHLGIRVELIGVIENFIDKNQNSSQEIKSCVVSGFMGFSEGINKFLQTLNVTMRTSGHNRPRINKLASQLDKEQRESNKYYM